MRRFQLIFISRTICTEEALTDLKIGCLKPFWIIIHREERWFRAQKHWNPLDKKVWKYYIGTRLTLQLEIWSNRQFHLRISGVITRTKDWALWLNSIAYRKVNGRLSEVCNLGWATSRPKSSSVGSKIKIEELTAGLSIVLNKRHKEKWCLSWSSLKRVSDGVIWSSIETKATKSLGDHLWVVTHHIIDLEECLQWEAKDQLVAEAVLIKCHR